MNYEVVDRFYAAEKWVIVLLTAPQVILRPHQIQPVG
jgi:hypothetical protein